jgi:HpcH/HpaI aldolase/citrate lyase family
MAAALRGAEFKNELRAGTPKLGLFLNSHSPTVAEQLAHSGYDWLLVDTQHGPMGNERLSAMLSGIANGGAKSLVRVEGYHDRGGIQQSLDMGADGVLVPYINTAAEARQAVSTARVGEFLDKGFTFISIGNDLHHVRTQAGAYVVDVERIAKEKGKSWARRPTALF